jgi:uncharacterized protein (TIRG00374 family)
LLKSKSVLISWWELARCYWIGTFFGNYLPTSVGGDVVRVMMFSKIGQTALIAASIAWERMTGLWILLGWSLAVLVAKPAYFQVGKLELLSWLMVIAGIILLALPITMCRKASCVIDMALSKRSLLAARINAKMNRFAAAVNEYRSKKKAILFSLLLSIPFYMTGVFTNYLIITAINAHVALVDIATVLPIVYLVSMLPISLNGLGLSEGAYVILFTQIGLSAPEALAAAVIRRTLHLLVSLIGGLFWLPKRTTAPEKASC